MALIVMAMLTACTTSTTSPRSLNEDSTGREAGDVWSKQIRQDVVNCSTTISGPTVEIKAPAQFKSDYNSLYLVVTNSTQQFEFLWELAPELYSDVTLQTNHIYTFLVSKKVMLSDRTIKLPEIIRIRDEETVIYDREICSVHQVIKHTEDLPIVNGIPGPPYELNPDDNTCRTKFPNFRQRILGGCVIRPDRPQPVTEPWRICSACKDAYSTWIRNHHATP